MYKVWREYESRTTDTEYADTLELAKVYGRNLVYLKQPRDWIEVEGHTNKWKLEGYGESGENCYIKKVRVNEQKNE